MITKREALRHFKTQVALARALGVTKGAVSHWPMDDPLPFARRFQLHSIDPKRFPAPDVAELRRTEAA